MAGASDDLEIYHNGSQSYVANSTGNLNLTSAGAVVTKVNTSEDAVVCNANGSVDLYHNNTKMFETTSFGSQTVFSSTNGDVSIFKVLHGNLSQGIGLGYNTILSTGSNTNITLTLQSKGSFPVNINTGAGAAMASFTPGGAAQLYHNGNLTTQTTSFGAEVYFGSSGGNVPIFLVKHSNATQGVGIGYDSIVSTGSNSNIPLNIRSKGSSNIQLSTSTEELMARFTPNGATELYHDNTKRIETTSAGATVSGALTLTSHLVMGASDEIKLGGSSQMTIWHTGSDFNMYNNTGQLIISNASGTGTGEGAIVFKSGNNNTRWYIANDGHFHPSSDDTFDIGTSSNRVRNLYTTDLQLSNEGKANDVDGTWGNYTIQEGESDLFLINNRSGKKYKFNLTEVS